MSYIGKGEGFGQRFHPPAPSAYLKSLAPHALDYERSPVSLSLIRDEIKAFRTSGQDLSKDIYMRKAIHQAFQAFKLPQPVKMLHLNDVFKQDLPIWSSSPGLPWTHFGVLRKSEIRDNPDHVTRVRTFWCKIKRGQVLQLPDCCAFARAHIVKRGETKVRCLWGYPATVTFGEAVFALPLIQAYMKGDYPIAYGYEIGNGGARKIISDVKGNFYAALDFKAFDKSVPEWLIDAAFDILFVQLDFVEYQGYGVARCDWMVRMWDVIVNYFINTPVRMCNGERYRKKAGIPSGSYFAQLIGSIVNYILIKYASLKLQFNILDIRVFGDNSIFSSSVRVSVDDIAAILEPVGMVVNVMKSGSSKNINDLVFLGYQLNHGFPRRERAKVVADLLWPERPDRCFDDVASRAMCILYANFGVDEMIDLWCRKVVSFKKFDLVLSRGQERFLDMLGFKDVGTEPPSMIELYLRLLPE